MVETEDQQRIAPATMFSGVFGDRSILLLDEFFVYVENAMGLVGGTLWS